MGCIVPRRYGRGFAVDVKCKVRRKVVLGIPASSVFFLVIYASYSKRASPGPKAQGRPPIETTFYLISTSFAMSSLCGE